MSIALVVAGPGLQEGEKSLHFDESVARQSTELDLSGPSLDITVNESIFWTFDMESG